MGKRKSTKHEKKAKPARPTTYLPGVDPIIREVVEERGWKAVNKDSDAVWVRGYESKKIVLRATLREDDDEPKKQKQSTGMWQAFKNLWSYS